MYPQAKYTQVLTYQYHSQYETKVAVINWLILVLLWVTAGADGWVLTAAVMGLISDQVGLMRDQHENILSFQYHNMNTWYSTGWCCIIIYEMYLLLHILNNCCEYDFYLFRLNARKAQQNLLTSQTDKLDETLSVTSVTTENTM